MRLTALIFSTIALFALVNSVAMAQEEPAAYVVNDEYNLYLTQKDSTALVFANMAYIRKEPSTKSELKDSISIGTEVKFLDDVGLNPMSLRGMYLPWQRVEYKKDNQVKTGYIWLGLLSLGHTYDKSSNNLFMYGFAWKSNEVNENYYWVETKVLDKDRQLLGTNSFPYYPGGQSYTTAELQKNTGLEDAKRIYSIKFLGEACGIASEYHALAWNDQGFIPLPKTSSVSDAGVFYYSEELIYPNQHKKGKDIILKRIEEGEADEDQLDSNEEIQFQVKIKEETFQKNGNTFQKIAERSLK
ncbi:hypothetical protein CHU00_18105 [Sphingobacterium cellulitidis]|uniref:SH3 domain-containing protein n=1 Tax=Sphingobacterium cellulitidis TaxID=1768011 RepID=UPI000B945DA6|nr:SH3 domain-containing protein [Sphingobacterium cellulitidis]OYD44207.1 hypothetical protein CHU00_18105 [Sphingobacterium cellulitidis]